MKRFVELLEGSAAAHGHLCPGQLVGERMAMLGCRLIGLNEPARRDQIKKLIVNAKILCKPCTEGCYFSNAREVTWSGMNWAPEEKKTNSGLANNHHGVI